MISVARSSCSDSHREPALVPLQRPVAVLPALSPSERSAFFPQDLMQFDYPVAIKWQEWKGCSEKPDLLEWEAMLPELNPEVIVGCWKMPPLNQKLLTRCSALRYVCYLAGSVRKKIDRSFLERGGVITTWGDEAAPSVAECALMLAMMCLRQATRFALEMHVDRTWRSPASYPDLPRPLTLIGKRVGIHGFGAVALSLQRLMAPFATRIEAFSQPVPDTLYTKHGIKKAESLASLYRDNDVVFIAESLTLHTQGSVDAALLDQLRPGSVLVNVARGPIIDEKALEALAMRGQVQIGLDVFTTEPLPMESPLRGLRNVTLLPHTGGPTIDCYPNCGRRARRNFMSWLAGEVPPDSLSLARYDMAT